MKGAKHAKFYEKLHNDTDFQHISMSEYEPDQKSTQLILVTASKFPVQEEKVFTFLSRPFAMYSDVVFPEGIVRIYNIHLQSVKLTGERKLLMFDNERGLRALFQHFKGAFKKLRLAFLHREVQALMLAESIKTSPYPVIVSGDFNDTPASYAYHVIAGQLNDASFFSVTGFKRTFKFSTFPLQIDYICTSPAIRSSFYKTIASPISDHFVISSKFNIEYLEKN
jgi:endonuclease/exonuclease/phosphatase family metal-dependent hydrolase